jgi:hypothetical protein
MTYYKLVSVDNLSKIQEDALKVFPNYVKNKNSLFYIRDSVNILLSFKSIKTLVNNFGICDYLTEGIAFNITQPKVTIPIHCDSGTYTYSLNIPLTSCKNTYVSFYDTLAEKVFTSVENSRVTYYRCPENESTLIKSVEINSPYILNTQIPHNVRNDSNEVRITMLIRINNKGNKYIEQHFNFGI